MYLNNHTNKHNYLLFLMHIKKMNNNILNYIVNVVLKLPLLEYLGIETVVSNYNKTMDTNILCKQDKKIKISKTIKHIQREYKTFIKNNVNVLLETAVQNQSRPGVEGGVGL